MRSEDSREHTFDFLFHRLTKRRRSKLHARLNQLSILRNGKIRILIFVIDNPALALRDYLVAKLFRGELRIPTCGTRPQ